MPLYRFAFILLPLLFWLSCTNEKEASFIEEEPENVLSFEEDTPALTKEDYLYMRYRQEAAEIAASLTDAQLAGQCLLTGLDNRPFLTGAIKSLLREIPVGGAMLFGYNLSATNEELRAFLSDFSEFVTDLCGIAPFIAVDHEGGVVHRFGPELMRLPPPASFWDMALTQGEHVALAVVENLTRISGEEIRSLGISLNLAPVAEILSAENKAFLETRSYGTDPDFVEKAASAFIRAMDAAGIASAVKHFPGNSADDPHFGSSVISADHDELDLMVRPFANIISGVRPAAVMVSHSIVLAIDPQRNASLSHNVISTWLRGEMGFDGIVLADDFTMRAISSNKISLEEAVVEAFNAGVDMVMCWSSNIALIHNTMLLALQDGRLKRERLLEAVERILAEKLRYGLVPATLFLTETDHE
ncbi:MAG: glycoside hydrolase family 3 protein [Treponema sp.]|jgi:beta-N-acetylhexosaminidase|nr:glycoside hydrolase family 3 protein [Treponema sp.]